MKKIIFIIGFLALFANSLNAMVVEFQKIKAPWGNKQMIQLIFDTPNKADHIGKIEQNWVAIYKKGTSNEWKNVIVWAWVKEIQNGIAPGDSLKNRYFMYNLPNGEYEFRFFLDNTYNTFASFGFTANNVIDTPTLSIEKQTETEIEFASTYNKKTWIGIYKYNDYKNDWKYVKAWSWVDNQTTTIDLTDLPRGEYKAKLFYNNSYKEERRIEFSHNGVDQDDFVQVDSFDGHNRINFSNSFQVGNKKSWIGVYKKGTSNTSHNRVEWKEVTKTHSFFYLKNLEVADYELRLFYDTPNNMVTKTEFKVDGKQVFRSKEVGYNSHNSYSMYQDLTYFAPMQNNDWVGLFEKGAEQTRANLISWGRPEYKWGRNIIIFQTPGRVGKFELVYFKNNSYKQVGNSLFLEFH